MQVFRPAALAEGSSPVLYSISFPNADHHEANVTVTFSDVRARVLEARMSRTSPGRYAFHEFAKNVYNVRAFDGRGNPLPIERPDPHQWNIAQHDGTVRIEYTLFGDHADGTYLAIDNTHAHINVPATFMWARGLEKRPVEIQFKPPKTDWTVATQLPAGEEPNAFTAPDLGYFMDSPIEIADLHWREWSLDADGSPQKVRLAIHHDGTEQETDAYMRLCQAVVPEAAAVFGKTPKFDFGTYTFIADYLPYVSGDGMEHRNSTILTSRRSIRESAVENLYTVAHEFFHAWNVERLRPKSLEPFRLEESNMSGELWFAEGFTSYYHSLILKRAGLISLDRYAKEITDVLNEVLNSPGRDYASPIEMSRKALFTDAATSVDRTNFGNTFISYYPYGAAIGLGLDLALRTQFPGISLDTFMRSAWIRHGRAESPYTNEDLKSVLAATTADPDFADRFFSQFIHGRELPPYRRLLENAGLRLRRAEKDKAWIGGAAFDFRDNEARLRTPTRAGTPLYLAGLDRNDILLTIDRGTITSQEQLEEIVENHSPGETVTVTFKKNGEERSANLAFKQNPLIEIVTFEEAGEPVTPDIRSFRSAWLETKAAPQGSPPRRFCPKCGRDFEFQFEFCHFDGNRLGIVPDQ